jgi:hypothetical protein
MRIFLSGLEASGEFWDIDRCFKSYKYILLSFYYLKQDIFERILDKSELIIIDSGAHSFQKGKAVDWVDYTKRYAEWIKKNDCEKIVGYFEMDVDNIIGYNKVLGLRKILESASDKVIPVWHKNRGIDEYKKMCLDYAGKVIAVTGFKNEDIKDDQYLMFLKYAKAHNCKVHCLGMTRKKVLNKVPFDYVDSSSWKQQAIYGRVGDKKVSKEFSKQKRWAVMAASLKNATEMQEHYYQKWRKVCKD